MIITSSNSLNRQTKLSLNLTDSHHLDRHAGTFGKIKFEMILARLVPIAGVEATESFVVVGIYFVWATEY